MHIGILGSGAIGGYYGSKLAKAGKDVSFVSRKKINQLNIKSIDGDFCLPSVKSHTLTQLPKDCDIILIATKTTENNHYLINNIKQMIKDNNTILVILQNGYGNEAFFSRHFPKNPIIGGICYIATKKESEYIHHSANGWIVLGEFANANLVTKQVINLFSEASIEIRKTDDIGMARWNKLLWNIPFNALSVIENLPPCEIANNPVLGENVKAIMLEIIGASEALGQAVTATEADHLFSMTQNMPATMPSMLIDYNKNSELEINYILEEPIKAAFSAGFIMKETKVLLQRLKAKLANNK